MIETTKCSSWVVQICVQKNLRWRTAIILKITKIAISHQQFKRPLQNLAWRCKMVLSNARPLQQQQQQQQPFNGL